MRRVLITFFVSCAILMSGCGHNTGVLTLGTRAHVGIDPQNITADVSYSDGLNISDISRENSCWIIEIDNTTGMTVDKNGTIKGVKVIRRAVGPQITGYLVDLSKKDPQLAAEYIKASQYFWQYQLKQLESK